MRLLVVVCALGVPLSAAGEPNDADKRRQILKLYRGYKKELGGFPEITVPQLLELRRKGRRVMLVDVREAREQRVSMLQGAIPAKDFLKKLKGRSEGLLVVAYCTIGYRSGQLVKKLRKRGINARNLVGGILMWTHHGQPLFRKDKPTKRLHVYGRTWDLARSGVETVY